MSPGGSAASQRRPPQLRMSAWIALRSTPSSSFADSVPLATGDRRGSVLEASAHEAYRTAVTVMSTWGPGRTSGMFRRGVAANHHVAELEHHAAAKRHARAGMGGHGHEDPLDTVLFDVDADDEERFGSTSSMSSPATRFSTDVRLRRARLRSTGSSDFAAFFP